MHYNTVIYGEIVYLWHFKVVNVGFLFKLYHFYYFHGVVSTSIRLRTICRTSSPAQTCLCCIHCRISGISAVYNRLLFFACMQTCKHYSNNASAVLPCMFCRNSRTFCPLSCASYPTFANSAFYAIHARHLICAIYKRQDVHFHSYFCAAVRVVLL